MQGPVQALPYNGLMTSLGVPERSPRESRPCKKQMPRPSLHSKDFIRGITRMKGDREKLRETERALLQRPSKSDLE